MFTYEDFTSEVHSREAIIKALNRMVAKDKITKLSKGRYYKEELTPFGTLEPERYQIVKDLIEDGDKAIGYLTGLSVYSLLGLTTQISNTIQIGKNDVRPKFTRGRFTISFVKQKNTITKENIPLLQILDVLRYIKKIPDTTPEKVCLQIMKRIQDWRSDGIMKLVRLAKKYPPSTRALLGAMLDECEFTEESKVLFDSLNPISNYSIPGVDSILAHTDKWNIE